MKKYYVNFLWNGKLHSVAQEAYNKNQALVTSDRLIKELIGITEPFHKLNATLSPVGILLNDTININ